MPFGSLWLQVVVAAVAVFILSSIIHMVLKYHRADYKRLSDEDSVGDAIRKAGASPGVYFIPYCMDMKQMKEPAMRKKFEDGPVAILTVMRSGSPKVGKNLVQWFALCFLVSFTAAYVARHTLHPGDPGMMAARVTGTVAFAGYAFGYFQDSIWKGIPWSNSLRGILDAVLYSLATGIVFCWLWPAA